MKANNNFNLIANSVGIILVINIITILINYIFSFDIVLLPTPKRIVLLTPFIWGTVVFIVSNSLKWLRFEYRFPLFRLIIWSPIVFYEIILRIDNTELAHEYPTYLLYLNNQSLLPISNSLLLVNDFVDNSVIRISISIIVLWIVFAVFEFLIFKIAVWINKIKINSR